MSNSSSSHCPRCGASLAEGSVEGLCAKCLGALNFATETAMPGEPVAAIPPLKPEELAPHFPQLEILECLGRGGMGVVYKARQKSLNRLVALKLLAPERAGDANFAERFAKEAQALAALNHPHIVAVYDFGQAGGFFYLLMEFVDGVNLRQLLQAKRLTPKEALSIVPPVCDALQCAHDHGIVHRDIKPENLLIDKAGVVKIADFGIAKMIAAPAAEGASGAAGAPSSPATMALGTPDYAAPEQRDASAATDHRADIYSLGVVLYEMLTGERPTEKIEAPSKRVQVDIRIDEIVLRALEKTPEMRFQTAAEFRTQVETIANPPAVRPTASRQTVSSFALAALLLLLGILIPVVGIRMHNGAILAAAEDHMKYVRTLQNGVTSLSTQMGEANVVAGRAASRAGNSAEREEARAQAREERHTYEQRSERLQADLERLNAALATAGSRQVDSHPWRAVSILVAGFLLAIAGGGMLMRIRRRRGAGRTMEPGGPAVGGPARGITTAALFIVWWFAALPFVAFCTDAIHAKDSFPVVVMLTAMPVFAMLGRLKAQQWRAASDAGSGPRWLRAFSWLGWLCAVPAVGLALFFLNSRMSETGSWNPAPSEAVLVPLTFLGVVLLPWAAAHLWQVSRFSVGTNFPTAVEAVRPPLKYAALLLLIPALIIGVLFVKFARQANSPSGVTSFDITPVEVRDNVVIVDVTTVVARGSAELRGVLDGPRLPAATEAALQETSFSPFAVILIKPTPNDGNPAWRIISPGRQMCRLGFALPDAALAKEAFENLRPIGPLPAEPGRTFAGTLFEVSQPGGETYRASLEVGPPIGSVDPRWVEVMGGSQQDARTVTLIWEVFASQPGLAQFSRAGSPIMVLKRQPQTELYSVNAGLELTRLDADRVLLVRRIGYHTLPEEFPGNFRDLADELLRTKTMSAKTTCGTTIELCQFQGKPFTVQVQSQASPLTIGSRSGVFGIGTMAVGALVLLIIAASIVLARRGDSAGKIVLLVVGALLLLLAIAFAVMVGVWSIYRNFGPGVSAVRFAQPGQSSAAPDAAQLEKPLIDGSLPDVRILVYAATGIEQGWVQIQSRLDPQHELVFFLGEEGSG